jgi:hypothetical protein
MSPPADKPPSPPRPKTGEMQAANKRTGEMQAANKRTGEMQAANRRTGELPAATTRRQKVARVLGGDSEFSTSGSKPKEKLNIGADSTGSGSYQGGRFKKWHFIRKIFGR